MSILGSGVALFVGFVVGMASVLGGSPAKQGTSGVPPEFYTSAELGKDADALLVEAYLAKYTPSELNKNRNVLMYAKKLSDAGYKTAQVYFKDGSRVWYSVQVDLSGGRINSIKQVFANTNSDIRITTAKQQGLSLIKENDDAKTLAAFFSGAITVEPIWAVQAIVFG